MAEKRILLAVPDPEALERFRLALGEHWEVKGTDSGTAALAELQAGPYDVIVAALDLPGIDGAELLNRTRKDYPKTVRFVLATEADKERAMEGVLGAHQFLNWPFDRSKLRSTIERTLALDDWIANKSIRELVARIRTFPAIPSLYLEVLAALRSPNATTEDVGAIIARDLAMMTKLLQVINSAYFGLAHRVTDPAEAVGLMGFETVKSMVMAIKLLGHYDKVKPVYFSIDRLWRHSTDVAHAAKYLALLHSGDNTLAEEAYTAGLMHDLGKVVLASNFDEQYQGAQSRAIKEQVPLWEVEKEIFGAHHGEIGAYLLGLWGMPLEVLEAAALHHEPRRGAQEAFTALTAVHIANAFDYEITAEKDGMVPPRIDEEYLAQVGVLDQIGAWREALAVREGGKPPPRPRTSDTIFIRKTPSDTRHITKTELEPVSAATEPRPEPASPEAAPADFEPKPIQPVTRRVGKQWWFAAAGVAALLLAWFGVRSLLPKNEPPPVSETAGLPVKPTPALATPVAATPVAKEAVSPSPIVTNAKPAVVAPISAPVDTRSAGALVKSNTAEVTAKEPVFPELKLQAIFYSAEDPTALINRQLLHVNGRLAEVRVVQILRTNVTVEYQNHRKVLVLK